MSSLLRRYRQHLWLTSVSLVAIAAACVPYVASQPGGPAVSAPAQAPVAAQMVAQLPTSIRVTVTEFKFTPTTVQVPSGQKISITLDNKGAVEHDFTIPATGFKLLAKAGQTATAEVTFDKPGDYEVICSIPGHKEAGMKGKLSVLAPGAGVTSQQPQPSAAMPVVAGMPMGATSSTAEVQPLPAGVKPLPAPQIALPTFRSESATVKLDLESKEVTATLADGVAYKYWTLNGSVPGPMLRVREGDAIELSLKNDPNAGVTHSIDLHAARPSGWRALVPATMGGSVLLALVLNLWVCIQWTRQSAVVVPFNKDEALLHLELWGFASTMVLAVSGRVFPRFLQGQWLDSWIGELLREDWLQAQSR